MHIRMRHLKTVKSKEFWKKTIRQNQLFKSHFQSWHKRIRIINVDIVIESTVNKITWNMDNAENDWLNDV